MEQGKTFETTGIPQKSPHNQEGLTQTDGLVILLGLFAVLGLVAYGTKKFNNTLDRVDRRVGGLD
ncbi:hypothetical protein A2841_03570 [Candidatus Kaiserbacteria bacterium RIFCSPHIGHO2_01_FULL_48_10]|uniref:Uncharacterized protein n=1 Tax=Candidatus Kaiserbacteria bacterium RIFCSPHIGHO2_01_FULL_48_10 TaxID=1798476 RepID=A0A1F6C2B8_9BACT|nr:MAG: hypothetical protein A2841_03570 [Candidatus Kaiserbacteria bacterium RIFCSPHIGHO2_01_FULL_48_10]